MSDGHEARSSRIDAAARPPLILAVDGGNSKTEAVMFDRQGHVAAHLTGPGSGGGPEHAAAVLDGMLDAVGGPRAGIDLCVFAAAGLDFVEDESPFAGAIQRVLPGARIKALGDAHAILSASAARGDAVAVVCGAGLNVVGRGPAGLATVPALGWMSGDWGGGNALGRAAVGVGYRSADGRGPHSMLEARVLSATGQPSYPELARAIRDNRVDSDAIRRLAPLVLLAAAEDDRPASRLVERATREIVGLALDVARRAWDGEPVPIGTPAILVGGLFGNAWFTGTVGAALADHNFSPRRFASRPVLGAVHEACEIAGLGAFVADVVDAAVGGTSFDTSFDRGEAPI